MYLSHYGLNQPPFSITPNPAFFYTGNKRGAILEALIYAITHGEGIIKVTGEVGSGKTMLCRMLEDMLPQNIEVIYLVNPTLGREEVVYAIAGELGLATGGKRPDEVIRMLQADLIAKHAAGKQVVLLVEEAQAMPLDTLEEIRLFSNLETAHHKLLQIVLFGQPELDENLNLPRMRQLKERITHSFEVPPLEADVIPDYLMFRMRAAGYRGPDIFSKAAVKQLAAVSEGVVRRISILADKSLLAAFADNTHMIEARHIKAAIDDSEFSSNARKRRRKTLATLAMMATAVLFGMALAWYFFRAANPPALAPANPPSAPAPVAASAAPAPAPVPASTAAASAQATTKAAPMSPAAGSDKSEAKTTPAASAAGSAASTTSLLRQRLTSAAEWLAKEAPQRYTIQVALLNADHPNQTEQKLAAREAELGLGPLLAIPTRINGRPQLILAHGSFASRPEAVTVRDELSRKLGRHCKLRTVEGLREETGRAKEARGAMKN